MGQQIPNGSSVAIASVMGTALSVTLATNANPCVLTVTNSLTVGSYVEYTCGWSKATNRVFRISAQTGTTVTLEGLNTTSITDFPAGSGVGSIRAITTWTPVLQILDFSTSGGEPQTQTFKYLENLAETEFISGVSAAAYEFSMADDISLAGYLAMKAASDTAAQVGFRVIFPSGAVTASAVKPFVNQNPQITADQLVTVTARLSIQNTVTRYAV
jgi:hypothetical protein